MPKRKISIPRALVWSFGIINLIIVILITLYSPYSNYISLAGKLLGAVGLYLIIVQTLLMGRIKWIESNFGHDKLSRFHSRLGYIALSIIVIHPVLIVWGNLGLGKFFNSNSPLKGTINMLMQAPSTKYGVGAMIILIIGVISTLYIIKKHLKWETWHKVHVIMYVAIILGSMHQILKHSGTYNWYWIGLYIFCILNILYYRLMLPFWIYTRQKWHISEIIKETPSTYSIYIKGNNIQKWPIKAGQFVFVRFLQKGFTSQEHPFSLSMLPKNNTLRLTIKNVGDYTGEISKLKIGTKAIISGPHGRFTQDIKTTNKKVLIAGGIGITPLYTLAQDSLNNHQETHLFVGNRVSNDIPLRNDIEALQSQGLKLQYILSNESKSGFDEGYISVQYLQKYLKDLTQYDFYICGPKPMIDGMVQQLRNIGIPKYQIHFESFALHR